MDLLKTDNSHYTLDCISCFAKTPEIKFRIRGIENYGNGYQVLFECPECFTCQSKRFDDFGMTQKLIGWLRKQEVVGEQPYRQRMTSLDQWYYSWRDEFMGYDFNSPKRFKRDQNSNWVVG